MTLTQLEEQAGASVHSDTSSAIEASMPPGGGKQRRSRFSVTPVSNVSQEVCTYNCA